MAPTLPAYLNEEVVYVWEDIDVRPAPADHWIVYRHDDGTASVSRCVALLIQEEVPVGRRSLNVLTSTKIDEFGLPDRFERRIVPADIADGEISGVDDVSNYVGMCHVDDLSRFCEAEGLTLPEGAR